MLLRVLSLDSLGVRRYMKRNGGISVWNWEGGFLVWNCLRPSPPSFASEVSLLITFSYFTWPFDAKETKGYNIFFTPQAEHPFYHHNIYLRQRILTILYIRSVRTRGWGSTRRDRHYWPSIGNVDDHYKYVAIVDYYAVRLIELIVTFFFILNLLQDCPRQPRLEYKHMDFCNVYWYAFNWSKITKNIEPAGPTGKLVPVLACRRCAKQEHLWYIRTND